MKKIKLIAFTFIVSFLLLIFMFNTISYSITVDAFLISSANFNIKGSNGIKTTFSDAGYNTKLKVGNDEVEVKNGRGELDSVVCQTVLTYISDNSYVKITFDVTNNSSSNKTIGIATYSDIMIDSNDSATVTNLSGNRGFTMSDGSNYTFTFLGRNSYATTDVDGYWFGGYGSRVDNRWSNEHPEVLSNTDSGMAFSWKDRTIGPNQTQSYSVVIGIGSLNEPPTITVTSSVNPKYTPSDQITISGTVNDLNVGDVIRVKYAFDGESENFLNSTSYTSTGTAKSYSGTVSLSGLQRGEHYIDVWAVDDKKSISGSIKLTFFVETDFNRPTATHTLEPPGWTNQNVKIKVTGSDAETSVKRIQLPSGEYVDSNQAEYSATDNNSYTFHIEDEAGNILEYVVTVDKIERVQPVVNITPQNSEWAKSFTAHVEGSDDGGSEFKKYQYSITNDSNIPGVYENEVSATSGDISISDEGNKYIHIIGHDNAGNISDDKIAGPYRIDHTNPVVEVTADFNTHTTDPLNINIHSTDALSGVKKVTFNGQVLEGLENTSTQVNKNGTYNLQVEDIAGNIYTEDIVISNIYRKCNAGLGHPDYTSSIDSCPICDLIQGLEVTSENKTYNAQEQGITYVNPQGGTVKEYYNKSEQKPIEAGIYGYELKVLYNSAEYNTGKIGQFTISPKNITITNITAENREYNGTIIVDISGGELVEVEPSDISKVEFTLPSLGTIKNKDVGQYDVIVPKVTLTGDKAKNYNLIQPIEGDVKVNITKRQTKVERITANNRQYNGTTVVEINRGNLTRIIEGDIGKIDYELSPTGTIPNKDIGKYKVTIPKITLTGDEAKNYEITQPGPEEVDVEITPKDITVTGLKAEDREYDGTTTVHLAATGLVGVENGEIEEVKLVLSETGTIGNKNIGQYDVEVPKILLIGDEAKNYNLTQPVLGEVKVNITKRKTKVEGITATNRQYDGTTVVELNRGNLTRIVDGDIGKVDYNLSPTGSIPNKDIGQYKVTIPEITLTGEESNNYEITQPGPEEVDVEITPKDINITGLKAEDREYDGTTTVHLIATGLVGVESGETEEVSLVLSETGTIENKDVGQYNVTIPKVTLSGGEAKNYNLTQPVVGEVKVNITKRQTKVEGITANDREYDGTTVVELNRGILTRIIESDTEKVDYELSPTGNISNKDIGEYDVEIPEITLTGDESKNYEITQPELGEVKVNVTRRQTKVEGITANNRQYNGTTVVELNRGNLTKIVDVDTEKVDYELSPTGSIPSKDIGEYKVAIPEITLTGEESNNYEINQPDPEEVDVEIIPKDINITKIKATDRQYDGTTIVALDGGELVGVEADDVEDVKFILPKEGTIENKDIGEYNVTIPEITLEGDETKNYNLIQPELEDVKVKINKRELTIENVKGKNRKYDKTNIVEIVEGELKNTVEGEDVRAVYPKEGTIPKSDVGKWNVTIEEIVLEGEDKDNYELIQPKTEEIEVRIIKPDDPKLQTKTEIIKINDKEVKDTEETEIRYGDKIQLSIKVFNKGIGNGYAKDIKEMIPEGLEYIGNSKINKENGWKKVDDKLIETEILNQESGEENELEPLKKETEQTDGTSKTEETGQTDETNKKEEQTEQIEETNKTEEETEQVDEINKTEDETEPTVEIDKTEEKTEQVEANITEGEAEQEEENKTEEKEHIDETNKTKEEDQTDETDETKDKTEQKEGTEQKDSESSTEEKNQTTEGKEEKDYREVLIELVVTEKNPAERIIENIIEIDQTNIIGEEIEYKKGENEEKEPIKISYTDFAINLKVREIKEIENDVENQNTILENSKLSKIEIHRKKIDAAKLKVKYEISITNIGEDPGNIDKIIEYLPNNMTLDSTSNGEWKAEGSNTVICDNITEKIEKNQTITKEITLQANANSIIGTNTNSILLVSEDDQNQRLLEDTKDKTTNTKEKQYNKNDYKETNNYSEAGLIVSISTGKEVNNCIIFLIIYLLISIAIIIGVKYKIKKSI